MIRTDGQWQPILELMPTEGPGIRGIDFLDSAKQDWAVYRQWFSLNTSDSIILDIGCGHGRMALNFLYDGGPKYIGIDIVPGVIKWAASAFNPWENIKFYLQALENKMYNPGGLHPTNFKLQMADKTVKGILALSLFTHLETLDVVEHYLMELRRVIRDDGTLVLTWFTNPVNALSCDAARSVFSIYDIYFLLHKASLKVVDMWGGETRSWHDQTVMIVRPITDAD